MRRTLTLRLLLVGVVLLLVLATKMGPVIFTFSPGSATADGHGVHLGDLLALPPALGALLPHRRRLRVDRRLGLRAPVSPNPGRRAGDRPSP